MNSEQVIVIFSGLFVGALTAFCAIMLWSKTRDVAWMLVASGTIITYGEKLYAVLNLLGIDAPVSAVGPVSLLVIVLSNVPALFYISAFLVMVTRSCRTS
jgi:hypothetical protein